MPYIHSKGNPTSDIWVLVDTPLDGDVTKGYLYSAPSGFVLDKMLKEAGISDYYITCYRPDTDSPSSWRNITGELNQYKPPIIIPLGAIGQKLCKELEIKWQGKDYNEEEDSEVYKYAGSLLSSNDLSYNHYIVPSIPVIDVIRQWKLRDLVINCDFAKAQSELEYYKKHGILQPLPTRTLKYQFDCFEQLLSILDSFLSYPLISNDIETIYPRTWSAYYKIHPGYPITIGLAPSKDFGISFDLFRESDIETTELWRRLNKLFKNTAQLGQNFFNFDLNFYESLGFEIVLETIQDTMIRHHVLWAELPHKLQFMTRQYTREKYYKDEGHGWTQKDLDGLKRYNCLDVCVTMEIYEAQEEEFKQRGYLR